MDTDSGDYPIHPQLTRAPSSTTKPKGILKNASGPSPSGQHSLQWDEANLALTEIQKDSLMKITEPKTPFVRYNAETDTVEGDIPDLDLYGRGRSPAATSPEILTSPLPDDVGLSSRRTSMSSTGRAGSLPRSGSEPSSRSTSFSLPTEARGEILLGQEELGEEVEFGEEMDEEAAAKHAAFVRARGRHYSNEAEAMKQAAQLIAEEDEEVDDNNDGDAEMDSEIPPVPPVPKMNGTTH